MMLQRTQTAEREACVALLTPKERECLDRWLGHATAKEIALDLGITHHAVEKRLKSARAKLGVTSTLEAARLLASVKGYGQAVSQSPEVGVGPAPSETEPTPSPLPWWKRRKGPILAGASIMSLFLLAALAFQPASPPAPTERLIVEVQPGPPIDLDNPIAESFASLDLNKNGVLNAAEIKDGTLKAERAPDGGVHLSALTQQAIASFDRDKDGTVSRSEFEAGMKLMARKPS